MLENMIWNFFEKTGSLEAYIEYKNIKEINSKKDHITESQLPREPKPVC